MLLLAAACLAYTLRQPANNRCFPIGDPREATVGCDKFKYYDPTPVPNSQQGPTNTNSTKSTGSVIDNSKSLQDCLGRVNNSESNQTIIDQGIQACYDKFR